MNIAIDAGCLGVDDKRLKVGVYHFALNFLLELSKIDFNNNYILYSFKEISPDIMTKLGKNFTNEVVTPSKGWMKIWLSLKLLRNKPDLFIALSQALPKRLSTKTKVIGVIHDVSFEQHPADYKGSYDKLHKNTQDLLKNSNVVITFSKRTKKEMVNIFKVARKKIVVLHEGVRLKVKKNKAEDHLLFVGALKKGKNVPNIILAFDIFHTKTNSDLKLLIVGGDKWLDKGIKEALNKIKKNTRKKIIFKGYVPDAELKKLYADSLAFVSPSLYEGFGLAHVEAMSAGVPIIASNCGSLPEVVQDAGMLVNPKSPVKIANAMLKIVSNKKYKKRLSRNGVQLAKNYSWKKFATNMHEIISSYEKA